MCDDHTEADNEALFASGKLTRRNFGAMAGASSLMLAMPGLACAEPAKATKFKGKEVVIATPDGSADAYFVAPKKGKHPAVLIWPDIMSLRPAFRQMADRLSGAGYAVLVINPYYRTAKAPVIAPTESFSDADVRARLMGLRAQLSGATNETDTKAFVGWLDAQKQVDISKGMATTGYCMGGPMTMVAAATAPDRIRAGASFHGGGVATDKSDSPHLLVPKMKASYLFAIADNDDQRSPDEKVRLREAFDAAKLTAEIEVYAGAQHGWCPPDSQVYNEVQAEKAWARQLALFQKALA